MLTSLTGRAKVKTTPFRWTEPAYEPIRRMSDLRRRQPEDVASYSPYYQEGGTVICPLRPLFRPPVQLEPTYLVPDDWVKFVAPAVRTLKARPTVLAHPEKSTATLQRWLQDPNPLVSFAACRALAKAGRLPLAFVVSSAQGDDPRRLAVLRLIFLNTAPAAQVAGVVAEWKQAIAEGAGVTDLEASVLMTKAGDMELFASRSASICGVLYELFRTRSLPLPPGKGGRPSVIFADFRDSLTRI